MLQSKEVIVPVASATPFRASRERSRGLKFH
jgi:hypothetical protein